MGFEPTAPDGVTGFQDQLLKPLGHVARTSSLVIILAARNPRACPWEESRLNLLSFVLLNSFLSYLVALDFYILLMRLLLYRLKALNPFYQ